MNARPHVRGYGLCAGALKTDEPDSIGCAEHRPLVTMAVKLHDAGSGTPEFRRCRRIKHTKGGYVECDAKRLGPRCAQAKPGAAGVDKHGRARARVGLQVCSELDGSGDGGGQGAIGTSDIEHDSADRSRCELSRVTTLQADDAMTAVVFKHHPSAIVFVEL